MLENDHQKGKHLVLPKASYCTRHVTSAGEILIRHMNIRNNTGRIIRSMKSAIVNFRGIGIKSAKKTNHQ